MASRVRTAALLKIRIRFNLDFSASITKKLVLALGMFVVSGIAIACLDDERMSHESSEESLENLEGRASASARSKPRIFETEEVRTACNAATRSREFSNATGGLSLPLKMVALRGKGTERQRLDQRREIALKVSPQEIAKLFATSRSLLESVKVGEDRSIYRPGSSDLVAVCFSVGSFIRDVALLTPRFQLGQSVFRDFLLSTVCKEKSTCINGWLGCFFGPVKGDGFLALALGVDLLVSTEPEPAALVLKRYCGSYPFDVLI